MSETKLNVVAVLAQAVDKLGGADQTTPKAVLTEMQTRRWDLTRDLNVLHLKSHLQKYRADHGLRVSAPARRNVSPRARAQTAAAEAAAARADSAEHEPGAVPGDY